jgi:hypothetical protein
MEDAPTPSPPIGIPIWRPCSSKARVRHNRATSASGTAAEGTETVQIGAERALNVEYWVGIVLATGLGYMD